MEKKNNSIIWKVISGVLVIALITVSSLYYINLKENKNISINEKSISKNENHNDNRIDTKNALSLWKDSSKLKAELTSYMSTITDNNSKDFIPVKNRIAVFDMDGTLCCETDPGYFDHKLLYHRVMEDADYKDKASEEEKETAEIIKKYFETGEYPSGLDVKHGTAVATAFKGMTIDEFTNYVKEYREKQTPGYNNLTNKDAFYKPMLQVVDLLQKNDFKVYIISGTDRLITRGLVEGVIDIPLAQMIGSDELLVASNQGEKDGLDYTFTKDDKVITGGKFLIKNLKMNKVSVIMQEIGEQPVLCFGNSNGDAAMANFTINNNKYKSLAYMLCCDDTVRENGNLEKANKMRETCNTNGFTPISMRDDWKTIYGENVTRVNTSTTLTEEDIFKAVDNYCHLKYDYTNFDNTDLGKDSNHIEKEEESENEYKFVFTSYTGSKVNFYINKLDGTTKITEYVPTLDIEEEVETINIQNYVNVQIRIK